MFQFKWVWHNLKGHRWQFILGMIFQLIASSAVFVNPMITAYIVDTCLTKHERMDTFVPALMLMLIIHFTRMGLIYTTAVIMDEASQGMLITIRDRLYDTLQEQDLSFYGQYRTGDLMTRLTGDLDMVRHFTAYVIRQIFSSILILVSTVIYLLTVNATFTLALVVLSPLVFLIRYLFSKRVRPMYMQLREKLSGLNAFAQENIEGNRVIKAFAREDFEISKFNQRNEDFRKANLKASYTWLKFWPGLEFISQSFNIIVILVGGALVINGHLSYGELVSFVALVWALSDPMRQLGMLLNDIERFFASANKVIELFYSRPLIVSRKNCIEPKAPLKGEVEFKDVCFSFCKQKVLRHVSFHVSPGETVAIMGETGVGKTSLVNLIARFYDVKSGSVLVDGVDVREYNLQGLRRNIGMATQDVFLFSDTIEGNISYGNLDMPDGEIKHMAVMADADGFINKMSEGYDTIVGERGVGLSGGQRQRIALARALAIKPRILILDDTTSAVDLETEKYIQEQLEQLDYPCTKFIIAQRISSVKSADKIIILKDGKIAEMGTHLQLLAQGGYYSEIFALQNSMTADAV